jgi:hypothetical protein
VGAQIDDIRRKSWLLLRDVKCADRLSDGGEVFGRKIALALHGGSRDPVPQDVAEAIGGVFVPGQIRRAGVAELVRKQKAGWAYIH